jgi:prepilin-type N-terminal cleavage/methylation domain-containing protein
MERRKMKKKGFTLVELLVVIAIIAMLLAILMPALGKVRQLAQRIMCSTNLSGLGKAMLTYSNDDKYESFPVAGASGSYWNRGTGTGASHLAGVDCFTWNYPKTPEQNCAVGQSGKHYSTISADLYLLVKIADTTPDQFICPGSDSKKFDLSNYPVSGADYQGLSFTDVWDFGTAKDHKLKQMGKGHNTYSYQLPKPAYSGATAFPISTTSNPARPVMADRNPYWSTATGSASTAYLYRFDTTNNKPFQSSLANGNNTYHQKEGQNVLYADCHAKFEKSANVGIMSDNIYTVWGTNVINSTNEATRQCGPQALTTDTGTTEKRFSDNADYVTATAITIAPQVEDDSYLVSDVDKYE